MAVLLAALGAVLRLKGPNYRLEGGNIESRKTFDKWTIVNEAYHLAWFPLFAGAVVWVFAHRGRFPYQLMLLGCLLNLYLILPAAL